VIPALGLDYLTRVRVLVQLHSTRLTSTFYWRSGGGFAWLETTLRIEDRDDVLQALVVLTQEGAQFALKLDLLFQAFITQAALEEVALWIRQQGSVDVARNINGALDTLNQNAEFIAKGIAELTVSSGIESWRSQ
jgi:hypothetical protein